MKNYSAVSLTYCQLAIKYLGLFLLLIFLGGCGDNESLKKSIYPCEDDYKKELVPFKKLATEKFINARFFDGYRVSDKYLVTYGDINRKWQYVVLNHQTGKVQFFGRPYTLEQIFSDCRSYQIHDDHLYLARLDRTMGWVMESVHLETLESQPIPIVLGTEMPKEILQVEKHDNDIYILAEFEKSSVIYKYSALNTTLVSVYTTSDEYKTIGFKIMKDQLNSDYLVRVAINETNAKTLIQGINPTLNIAFYSQIYDGIVRSYNYPFSKEVLPMDSKDRIYLNFRNSRSLIIDAISGRNLLEFQKQVLPISSNYAVNFSRNDNSIDPEEFDIINQNTGERIIDAKYDKKFHRFEIINQKYLIVDLYYDWSILNLETSCVEYKIKGECYKINENEFLTIDYEGIYYYKL